MTIRRDGIIISSELLEKLKNLSFINETNVNFSTEEVYLCKLITDAGLSIAEIRPSFIFDINQKCIRKIREISNNELICEDGGSTVTVPFDKALNLPLWSEARKWIKGKGFKLDFHYDPFSEAEGIKIGFMKSRALTGTDNVILEADGRTDLEAVYKIILELLKYEKEFA
jgi:hypothetical protein